MLRFPQATKLQAPLFTPSLCFALGIQLHSRVHWILLAVLGVCVLTTLPQKYKAVASGLLLFLLLGATRSALHLHHWPPLQSSSCAHWQCSTAQFIQSERFPHYRCDCSSRQYPLGTIVEWEHDVPPELNQRILAVSQPFRSRGAFDLAKWKRSKGISCTLLPIKTQLSTEKLLARNCSTHKSSPPKIQQLRRDIEQSIQDSYSGDTQGLLHSITTGNRSKLGRETKRLFSQSGLAHLLAVSGYHVGLICFIPALFMRSKRDFIRWLASGLAILASWGFVAICNWPSSGIRAATMVSIYAFSNAFRMDIQPIQIWSLAFAGMMIWQPLLAHDIGTILSFSAVLAIFLFLRVTADCNKSKSILRILGIPIAAQLGTAFIAMPTFKILPIYSWPLNLVAQLSMPMLGGLIVLWGFCNTFPAFLPFAAFCRQLLSRYVSCHLDALNWFGEGRPMFLSTEDTSNWFWWAISGLYFICLIIIIQSPKSKKTVAIRFTAMAAILIPWGLMFPVRPDSIKVRNFTRPALYFQDNGIEHIVAFHCRDSAAAVQKFEGAFDDGMKFSCLKNGESWFHSNGDFMIWTSNHHATGKIAKRPCNYRYTGEQKGFLMIDSTRINWQSWGVNVDLN